MISKPSRRVAAGLLATGTLVSAAGPCDIYASANNPCVAAHATTRALYSSFNGPLYQVKRDSDSATLDIKPVSAGGVANSAAQDSFCSGTTCSIQKIYDQSPKGNHLSLAPPGGAASGPNPGGYDDPASAIGAPVYLNGAKAYGAFIHPGAGYRNNAPSGIATGDTAQGIYALLDGTHYNDQCCFDYGNAETNNKDTGNGHMEAIYFGNCTFWGSGAGLGPWLMADLENGLFAGPGLSKYNNVPAITSRFYTTVLKGKPGTWSIRGGDATSGNSLSTYFAGQRPPNGYDPMSKEGAILLGIGGDNSNTAQGTFYEGVMTSGYPSDATENSVQANIAAAKYSVAPLSTGPALTVGNTVTIHVTTAGYDTRFLSHSGSDVVTSVVSSSSSTAAQQAASWTVRTGLGNSGCYSFESVDSPGSFIRHYDFALKVQPNDRSKAFLEDATFCTQPGLSGSGTTIRAWGYPLRFVRHYNNVGYIAENGGPRTYDAKGSFNADVTFSVGSGFGS
jgi:hypothetical protein